MKYSLINDLNLHNANALKNVKWGCTEYAVMRLTGRNLLAETGLKPEQIGLENLNQFNINCTSGHGKLEDLKNSDFRGAMLRIRPQGQDDLHTILFLAYLPDFHGEEMVLIEDQFGRVTIPLKKLTEEWKATGNFFAICNEKIKNKSN